MIVAEYYIMGERLNPNGRAENITDRDVMQGDIPLPDALHQTVLNHFGGAAFEVVIVSASQENASVSLRIRLQEPLAEDTTRGHIENSVVYRGRQTDVFLDLRNNTIGIVEWKFEKPELQYDPREQREFLVFPQKEPYAAQPMDQALAEEATRLVILLARTPMTS